MAKQLLGTAVWLQMHFVAGIALLVVLLWVLPHFAKMFAVEFVLGLPVITQGMIGFSRWTCANWWQYIPAGFADAVVLLVLRFLPSEARWLFTLWATLVLVVMMSVLAAAILATGTLFRYIVATA